MFLETQNLIHYGKLECPVCNKWIKWVSNPTEIRTKTSIHKLEKVIKFYKINEPFCFFCLREQKQLGIKETLTRDHIQELDKGGKDELENLQILCSACHKLKNWCRLYINWHNKND